MRITREWLEEQGACDEGVAWFEDRFPSGGELADVMPEAGGVGCGYGTWLAEHTAYTGVVVETDPDGIRIEEHYREGKRHREGGPAWIMTSPDGTRRVAYYRDGLRHREGGPAWIVTYSDGTRRDAYWRDGQRIS